MFELGFKCNLELIARVNDPSLHEAKPSAIMPFTSVQGATTGLPVVLVGATTGLSVVLVGATTGLPVVPVGVTTGLLVVLFCCVVFNPRLPVSLNTHFVDSVVGCCRCHCSCELMEFGLDQ